MIPLPFQNWKIIQNFYAPKLDFKDSYKAKSNLMKTDFGSQLNFRSNEISNEIFKIHEIFTVQYLKLNS